ncbi:hypothetical protein ACFL20_12820, partial [Spirochaetota bacterium]
MKIFKIQLLLILIICSFQGLHAYDRSSLVDKKSKIILRFSDISNFVKAIEDSPIGKLWNSVEMKPFLNNQSLMMSIKRAFIESSQSGKKSGKEMAKLKWESINMIKGELVIALSMKELNKDINFFVMTSMDKKSYERIVTIDEKLSEIDEALRVPRRRSFQGVEYIQYFGKNKNTSANIKSKKVGPYFQSFYGNTMVLSNNIEWVKKCIIKLKSELPAEKAEPPSIKFELTDGFVKQIIKNMRQKKKINVQAKFHMPTVLYNLGIDGLDKISFDVVLGQGSFEMNYLIKNSAGKRGVWTLLDNKPVPANHRLAYVPADVYSYQVSRLDLNAFWLKLPLILQSINPQIGLLFNMYVTNLSKQLDVDITNDIIGNLDTLITNYYRLDGINQQVLYSWQLRNPLAM